MNGTENDTAGKLTDFFIKSVENNVNMIRQYEKLAEKSAKVDEYGNWSFEINTQKETADNIVSEKKLLRINKAKVIKWFATPEMIVKASGYVMRKKVYESESDYKGSRQFLMLLQNDPVRSASLEKKINRCVKDSIAVLAVKTGQTEQVAEFMAAQEAAKSDRNAENRFSLKEKYVSEISENAQRADPAHAFDTLRTILVSEGVMPKIVNTAIERSAENLKQAKLLSDSLISPDRDNGYCTKSLLMPMYMMKRDFGGFEWLPDSAEKASHPQTLLEHLKKSEYAGYVHGADTPLDLNSEVKKYRRGAIVLIHQKGGHMHAMMYDGIDVLSGEPRYTGFNNNVFKVHLADKKGVVIDLPGMIEKEVAAGKIRFDEKMTRPQPSALHTYTQTIIKEGGNPSEVQTRGQRASIVDMKIFRKIRSRIAAR